MHREDLSLIDDTSPSQFKTNFKGLRKVTRILTPHARNLRRVRYGKALLRLLIKKTSVAFKSIDGIDAEGTIC